MVLFAYLQIFREKSLMLMGLRLACNYGKCKMDDGIDCFNAMHCGFPLCPLWLKRLMCIQSSMRSVLRLLL
jgi:hypothetical protein